MDPSSGTPKRLDRLREAAEALNEESDQLTAALRETESAINSIGLGIEAQLKDAILKETQFYEDKDGNPTGSFEVPHFLGYGKRVGKSGNSWGIYIESELPSDFVSRGILELRRELRVLAAKHLPALLDLLAIEAEKLVKEVQEAKASAREAAKKLK